jgi:integrase
MVEEHGCICVQEITTEKLQAWFNEKAKTVKVVTAAAYLLAIQHFLKWCMEERHLLLTNVAKKVRVPKYNKNVRRRFLGLLELQRLIDNCEDLELKFAIYCMSHAGMRYCECDEARPEWFDMGRKLIQIQASDSWQPKNGKNRVVPMTSEFYEFLQVYGRPSPFMLGPHKEHKGRWRYRYDLRRQFNQLTSELGLEISPHDLRRTFASLKVSSGVSIFKVARWLGNRVEICERHYAHLSPIDTDIDIGFERKAPLKPAAA